jgi:asparagine synthase (glutamine-hydrolysing)
MPGLIGIIGRGDCSEKKHQLEAMMSATHREDFYRRGTFVDESLGVYVGWTALEGSFADEMPIRNEKGDVALFFSGEEYSGSSIRQELKQRGHCVGQKEAAYLVHLCEDDPRFVEKLNGMFHGLAIDFRNRAAVLFNDRYGMQRLYCHEAADGFYFASEAKAILAVRPELRTIDPQGLGEFVSYSCVLGGRTVFKGIHVMPAASEWAFKGAQLASRRTYFDPHANGKSRPPSRRGPSMRNFALFLRQPFLSISTDPERLGIAMTGGLDTRVILALHPVAPGSLPSYTFGGTYRDSFDVRIGREIAGVLHQPHQVIEVGEEFLRGFAGYAESSILISEGTVDVYRASDLYISKKVREIAPAKIVGTYGSEIIRHAAMFKPSAPVPGLFSPDFLPYLDEAASTYAEARKQHPVTFAAFIQSPWYHYGILAIEKSQITVRSPFMDNDFVRTAYRAPQDALQGEDVRLRLIRGGSATLAKIPSDRGVIGHGGPFAMLRRASREFTFKSEYAYDYGMPASVARVDHLFSGLHLERIFLGRHKLTHFRVWYRDQLARYVREILLDPRALGRPYLQKSVLEAVVDGHTRRGLNYTTAIHKLLTLELLHRLFFDAS